MSNKTRLQTNNTNLQELINKANALPDAGSGGGGSVETCTVTLSSDAPSSGTESVYYTNGSNEVQTVFFPLFGDSINITVLKNSILTTYGGTPDNDNILLISYEGPYKVCFVMGDGTITLM